MSATAMTPMHVSARRSHWARAAAFVVCATLLFVPFIIFVINRGSYLQTGHEALAYRYFLPYRLASEEGVIWISQGWATVILQRVIFSVQALFVSPERQLRQSMELFGLLTTIVQSGVGLLLMVVAFRDRSLHVIQKAAIVLALLIPLFCSAAGNYYWMLPDYYQLNVVLLAGLVYCFSKAEGLAIRQRWTIGAALLGIYLGVVVANKVSLALPCLIPLIPIVIATTPGRRILGMLSASFAGALVGFTVTVLLMYAPRWSLIDAAIGPWLAHVRAPASEIPLSIAFIQSYLVPNNYLVMGLLYVATWFVVMALLWTFVGWRSNPFRQSVALAVLGFAAPLPLVVKQSGTTVFEVFLTLTLIAAVQISLLASLRKTVPLGWVLGRLAAVTFVIACGIITVRQTPWVRMADTAARSSRRAELVWSLRESVQAAGFPVIVVTPDNDHSFGTPEEALLRGFADFPTWVISTGQPGIDRFYPDGLRFRTIGDATHHPNLPYPRDAVIVWFDVVSTGFPLLLDEYPALQEAVSRPDMRCRHWADPDTDSRRATVCTPGRLKSEVGRSTQQ